MKNVYRIYIYVILILTILGFLGSLVLLCERKGEILIKVEVRLFANLRGVRKKKQIIKLEEGTIIRDVFPPIGGG